MESMEPPSSWRAIALVTALVSSSSALAGEPPPDTVKRWEEYLRQTEKRIAAERASDEGFVVMDFLTPAERSAIRETLQSGGVHVQKLETRDVEGRVIEVPGGMIHHWYGAIFVPGVNLEELLEWVQNYADQHRYFSEVVESRLLSREQDTFTIFLKLRRTKVLTVHYNTEHRVTYQSHGAGKVSSTSEATHIAELEDPGTDRERERSSEQSRDFLWRLNSYWRFQQEDRGVVVECETISLSRAIPTGMAWLVQTFVESVPKESLTAALLPLRRELGNQ
jgi:hypothetical protein